MTLGCLSYFRTKSRFKQCLAMHQAFVMTDPQQGSRGRQHIFSCVWRHCQALPFSHAFSVSFFVAHRIRWRECFLACLFAPMGRWSGPFRETFLQWQGGEFCGDRVLARRCRGLHLPGRKRRGEDILLRRCVRQRWDWVTLSIKVLVLMWLCKCWSYNYICVFLLNEKTFLIIFTV